MYNVVVGRLNKEQAKVLAEGIIEDIIAQDSDISEITLLFSSSPEAKIVDVAQVVWESGELSVFMKD